jgi:aspartyl-tRNA(Asn)/glutamyl-tRNA(Gln) amidotransferase subunit B
MATPAKSPNLIRGATGDWEVVIGMEVHAQVRLEVQAVLRRLDRVRRRANSHVSLVDAAMPGMLPVINEECVRQAVRTGLGLKAQINKRSVFDRKNYFYPDLPQGYQISQYKQPIVGEGVVSVDLPDGRASSVDVGIERLHLEQDAGKSLHDQHPTMSLRRPEPVRRRADGDRVEARHALVRGGQGLSDQAAVHPALSRHLRRQHGEGLLRADVNVSVRRPGEALGTRCEIKNVNSIRFIGQAIEYEARRQIEIRRGRRHDRAGDAAVRPGKGETRSMRSKEEAHDYRYFPDPDLLPLEFDDGL